MNCESIPRFQSAGSLESLILDSFGLSPNEVQYFTAEKQDKLNLLYICLEPDYPKCPDCGHEKPVILSYNARRITHDFLTQTSSVLIYRQRRYRCPICGKTYLEKNPFTFRRQRVSVQTVDNVLQDLKSPACTFRETAYRHNLSPTTVQNIFDRNVSFPDHPPLPEFMIMDEVYAFHSKYTGYVCLFIDGNTGLAIDVLPTRRKDDLIAYFKGYSKEERAKVKFFCSDMYKTYQDVAQTMFPNAVCAVDRFHVRKLFTDKAQAIRINIMKGNHLSRTTPEQRQNYSLLKNHNDLLFVNRRKKIDGINGKKVPIFDPNGLKEYSPILRYKANKRDILLRIFEISPKMKMIREISDLFDDFFRCKTREEAEKKLKRIHIELEKTMDDGLLTTSKTLYDFENEILNSFTVTGILYEVDNKTGALRTMEKRLNSGLIENRNRIIKIIKNTANGYKNWPRFRNRVLYVLNRRQPVKQMSSNED